MSCAAARRVRSRCSLTITHRWSHRQRITVHSDRISERQLAAIVDVGHDEALAFPARDSDIAVGREVRATSHRAEEDRRRIIWRVADEEHERQRARPGAGAVNLVTPDLFPDFHHGLLILLCH